MLPGVMVVVVFSKRALQERQSVGWGELFWKEMKRAEPISRSQVVKLKVCDPMISQVGRQMTGC